MKRLSCIVLILFLLSACSGAAPTTTDTSTGASDNAATEEEGAATDGGEAPAEDSGEAATEDGGEAPAEDSGETATEDSGVTGGMQTFTIVPEESKISYAVGETFFNQDNKFITAIGVTQEIQGEVHVDKDNPSNSKVGPLEIDISALQSDDEKRDKKIREQWLESATYPIATFESTSVEGLPESYTDGEEVTFQIIGDLTVRETTTPVTFDTTAQINGNEMAGTATGTVQMTDFGFEPPDIANILKAENDVELTFEFVARADETAGGSDETTADDSTEVITGAEPITDTAAEAPAEDSATTGDMHTFTIVPEESKVSYAVGETFLNQNNKFITAIGVTQEIQGEVHVDTNNPSNSKVGPLQIDINALQSDDEKRDKAIRERWLESATHPIATFQSTSVEGLPESYTDGEEVAFQITGDLTVRETTVPVTFDTTAQINGNEMAGTATGTVQMTDFGFEPPNIANILTAENDVELTFEFVARSSEPANTAEEPAADTTEEPAANAEGGPVANAEGGPAQMNITVAPSPVQLPASIDEAGTATVVVELLNEDGTPWTPPDENQRINLDEITFGEPDNYVANVDTNGKAQITLQAKVAGMSEILIVYVTPDDRELSSTATVEFQRPDGQGVFDIAFEPGMEPKTIDMGAIGTAEIPGDLYDIPVVMKFTPTEQIEEIPEGMTALGGFTLEFFFADGGYVPIVEENVKFPTPIKLTYTAEGATQPSTVIWNMDDEQWVEIPSDVAGTTVTSSLPSYGDFAKLDSVQ